jgi:addiction module HigA family antidote
MTNFTTPLPATSSPPQTAAIQYRWSGYTVYEPLAVTQGQLAKAMGVSRRMINEICNNKRSVTVDTALMLAKVFGNTPDFWLNVQRRNDIWAALHTPKRIARVERARPIQEITA